VTGLPEWHRPAFWKEQLERLDLYLTSTSSKKAIPMNSKHASRQGTVTISGDSATLTFERRLRHPIDDVWAALTEEEHLARWFMAKARIDARAGGTIDFLLGPSQWHATGRIVEWRPPHVFEHERNIEVRPDFPLGDHSIVRWELTRISPDETHLKLVHRRIHRQFAVGVAPATHALLDRLENELDHEPLVDFRGRMEEVRPIYAVHA
jgi:uncharacterized protein YndB with AHSA1/START domain